MGTFFAQYPASSGGSSANASVGPNGQPIPTSATLVAGENPTGDLQPVQTDASGNLKVDITSTSGLANPLPVMDAAAEASLASIDTTTQDILTETQNIDGNTGGILTSSQAIEGYVNSIDAKTPNLGPALSTSSVPVVLATDQIPLPTSNLSIGPTGSPIPDDATLMGAFGIISGNFEALWCDDTSNHSLFVSDSVVQGYLATLSGGIGSIGPGPQTSVNSVSIVPATDSPPIPIAVTTPAAGTITQTALTVGTTAVRLTVSGSAPAATRRLLAVTPDNASTAKFYIGSATVTSTGGTRGIQIVGGQPIIFENDASDYYIVSDTAAQTVYVMETV